jgi:hypothetical protein
VVQMKKAVASITLLCYVAVSCGVIINFHYCMDQVASTQLFVAESKSCGKCGMHMDKSSGCCRDEVKLVKLEVDQRTTSPVSFDLPAISELGHSLASFLSASLFNAGESIYFKDHSPPILSGRDRHLQNCVFRI